jgi:hypothetical protein
LNKFVAAAWSGTLLLLSGAAAHAVPVAPAPEASTNLSFGLMLALGVGVVAIVRKKAAKHSA